jgi:glutathione synthase/RimK-type ligase-like ATP-grasp enzyme
MSVALAYRHDAEEPPTSGRRLRPRIAIAADARLLAQRQPAGLAIALTVEGYAPILLDPEDEAAASCAASVDLLVARGRSPALLDLLHAAESLGVPVVNGCAALTALADAPGVVQALRVAGIPTPGTRIGTPRALADAAHSSDFPMRVKPAFASAGRAARYVRTPRELARVRLGAPLAVAHRCVPADAVELDLDVIGGEVFASRRPSADDLDARAAPVRVTRELRQLALRCGILFGLELYSVACVETARGTLVVDVDAYPNYTALDDADRLLARHVLGRAQRLAPRRAAR